MKNNSEIRFNINTEYKKELDEFIKNDLCLSLSSGYECLLSHGLSELKLWLSDSQNEIEIKHLPSLGGSKRIFKLKSPDNS